METQKIALFGAETKAGRSILKEALNRGHKITAITLNPEKVQVTHPNLKVIEGDIINKNDIGSKIKGHDTVISVYTVKSDPSEHVRNIRNLIEAVNKDNIRQLIVTGHPGTSEPGVGVPLPANAEGWNAIAEAQRKTLETMENEKNFRWGYVHHPGIEKAASGKLPLSDKILVKCTESEQWVSVKDYAPAVLNEVEHFTEAHTEL